VRLIDTGLGLTIEMSAKLVANVAFLAVPVERHVDIFLDRMLKRTI